LEKAKMKDATLRARLWNLRAEVLTALGLTTEAKALAEKAHAARLEIHGEKHIETLESHDTLEYLNFGDGYRSLATREKLFGKGHVQTAPSYVLIARVRAYNERAEQCLRQAMRLYQKIDPEHAELAEAWSQLGRHQRIRENYDDAEQTLEHALKHWRR